MLQENPKLRKLWRKTKKTVNKHGTVGIDLRHKSSEDFIKGFGVYVQGSLDEVDKEELQVVVDSIGHE